MFTTKNLLMLIGRHALIAGAAVLSAAIAVWFLSREIERVASSVVQNHKLASTLEKRIEFFSTLKRDADIVGTNDILIDHAFIPSDNILDFVSVLEKLALKNSLSQNLNFGTPEPSAIASSFPLSTVRYGNVFTSNISGISKYLKDFESLPYFTNIESLNMSSQDEAGLRSMGTASFRATLYAKTSQ